MSFLIPNVLWALPALLLPLAIHLASQLNTTIVDFSSINFLRKMEHDSIRRLQWHQLLIILVRTLIILFIILVLARPVVQGYFQGWLNGNASTLSIIVIDNSFSMSRDNSVRDRQGVADRDLYAHLKDVLISFKESANGSRVLLVRATDAKVIYDGNSSELPSVADVMNLSSPEYLPDNLGAVVDTLNSPVFRRESSLYANREMLIISDFPTHQQAVLQELATDTTYWDDWHFFLVPTKPAKVNVAVTGAEIQTTIPLVGELMNVLVTLRNTGSEGRRKIPVQVVLNGVRSGQLTVDMNAGEQRTVGFQVAPTAPGHQEGYAEIERDDRPGDNRYYFHTYIPPTVKVLLIQPPEQASSFSSHALQSLAAATTQIQLKAIDETDLSWEQNTYDLIILNSVTQSSRIFQRRLEEFLRRGGNIIIVPGSNPASRPILEDLAAKLGLPAIDTSPIQYATPVAIDKGRLAQSPLREVFSREINLDELPTVNRTYAIDPRGTDEVIVWINAELPLLTSTAVQEGSVFLFALPFELQWNDLGIRGSFIPLWHRLVYWQAASPELADLRVGQRPILTVSPRQATQSMTLVAPQNITSLIICFLPEPFTNEV